MPDPLDKTRLARADARIAARMSQRLVDAIAREGGKRRFGLERVIVIALATLVHAVTLVFLAAGVGCLVLGTNWPVRVLGVVCLLVAVAVAGPLQLIPTKSEREQRRRTRGPGLMDAATYPATHALVVEIARLVGSPVPDRLGVDPDFNAYTTRRGRRRVLVFGAQLWALDDRGGRIATLAHELGHFAHGDLLQGWYVGAAQRALDAWSDIFDTHGHAAGGMTRRDLGPLVRLLVWPVRLLLVGYRRLLELASGPSRRRQEHYADLASAVAAGTTAAVRSLEVLLFAPGIEVTVHRAAINREDLAVAIDEFRRGLTEERRAAARRTGDIEKSRIDDSHPPTMERIRLLESAEPVGPAVRRTEAEWEAIEAEWADAVTEQLGVLADLHRYVH